MPTVPAIETLEKLHALSSAHSINSLRRRRAARIANLPKRKSSDDIAGQHGKDARFLNKLRRLLAKWKKGIASSFSTWLKDGQ